VTDRKAMIEQRLRQALSPVLLEIVDESHEHAGHPGARSGGGHFDVTIVSPHFTGKTLLQRHRLVYEALGEAMREEIHALSIKALAPDEPPKT
jgi:BolA family transcriptional regulator, general stress-responsive regulator